MARDYSEWPIRDLLDESEAETIIEADQSMSDHPILSEAQRLAVREAVYVVLQEALPEHIKSCPVGKRLDRAMWLILGIAVGSGLLGAGISAVMIKVLGA